MSGPLTWWELDRTRHAVVRLAQPWLAHGGRVWAMVEIENIGDVELGVDHVPGYDALELAFLGGSSTWMARDGDDIERAKLARIRFEEGTICARLAPGERWRVHSNSLELARVKRAVSATPKLTLVKSGADGRIERAVVAVPDIVTAMISGAITLVTEADEHIVEFEPPPVVSAPLPTIDLGPPPNI